MTRAPRADRPRSRARALAALLLVVSALVAPSAALAGPPRVVLVQPHEDRAHTEEALLRAQAELRAAGFATIVVRAEPSEQPRDSFRRADPTAIAVIALSGGTVERSAEVWVEDRLTGKISIRAVEAQADPHRAAADLAIQAVELLRASLIEIEASRPKPAGAPPRADVPPEAKAFAAAPDRDEEAGAGGLVVGAGASLFVGMRPASVHVAPTIVAQAVSDVGLGGRLRWAGPGAGPSLDVPEGEVAWTPWLLTAGALHETRVAERILLRGGADVGLLHVSAAGELAPPAESREGSSLDAAFLAGGAAGILLSPAVSLVLGAEILVAAQPPVVRVGGRDEAIVGRPWLFFPLTLEVRP